MFYTRGDEPKGLSRDKVYNAKNFSNTSGILSSPRLYMLGDTDYVSSEIPFSLKRGGYLCHKFLIVLHCNVLTQCPRLFFVSLSCFNKVSPFGLLQLSRSCTFAISNYSLNFGL